MTHYELKYKDATGIEKLKGRLIISYSRGMLKRIDRKAGDVLKMPDVIRDIPMLEKNINPYIFKKIENTAKEDAAFFVKANAAWCEFYRAHTGIDYRFGAGDALALKKTGQHLISVAGGVEEALDAWKYLLKNWKALPDFYRNNVDLKFINSQLNKILNLMKNGQQTGQAEARNHANDFRRRFKQGDNP